MVVFVSSQVGTGEIIKAQTGEIFPNTKHVSKYLKARDFLKI